MKELEARSVLLIKAIESVPMRSALLTDVQRQQASEVALAACPRPSSESKRNAWAERFLAKRAIRLLDEATVGDYRVRWLQGKGALVQWVTMGLPLLALLVGLLTQSWGNLSRVDLLSPALWGLLIWNWGVFALIAIATLRAPFRTRVTRPMIAAAFHNISLPRRWAPKFFPILTTFQQDWLKLAGGVMVSRGAVLLHVSAAMLAAGMLLSLFFQGWSHEYHVGWESQHLGKEGMLQVFAVLARMVGMLPMNLTDIERLHHWSESNLADGGYWFALLERLILFTVVFPRLLLAAKSGWSARRTGRNLKLDLSEPYFAALLFESGGPATQAVVYPYSFTLSPSLQQGLRGTVVDRLGKSSTLQILASTAYGESLGNVPDVQQSRPSGVVTKAIALFSMSATPEREAHGEFLQQLCKRSGSDVEVWVDASAFEKRLGSTGGSSSRVAEREGLWQQFAAQLNITLRVVNLERSQQGA
jgi:hypothetical protein